MIRLKTHLNVRKRLTEASQKQEKLKSLEEYDVDSGMHVLVGAVDVHVLQGDFEEATACRYAL